MFFRDIVVECRECKGRGKIDSFEFKNIKMMLLFWFLALCGLVVFTLFSIWLHKTFGHLPPQFVHWLDLKLVAYMAS